MKVFGEPNQRNQQWRAFMVGQSWGCAEPLQRERRGGQEYEDVDRVRGSFAEQPVVASLYS